ncbi:hypothetical protein C8Q73DRAFT_650072 [Cubamyces lactineus]|nr:hypothetical protein C8Q73DRAFT_650072 [Cubamyces lactineus]
MNLDVLRLILARLTNADLLKITYVSRALRDEAYDELLTRPIHLHGQTRLRSFFHFVLHDNIHRLSFVRTLTIRDIDVQLQPEEDALVSILNACSNLRSLNLHLCDNLLENHSRVAETIASLTTLTGLSIWLQREGGPGQLIAWNIVLRILSKLKHLRLPLIPFERTTTDLRDLAITHPYLEDLMLHVYIFSAPEVPFQALRSLTLTVEDALPDLQDLETTFPNVRKFVISHYILLDVGDALPPGHMQRHAGGVHAPAGWKSLDYLSATPAIIRVLGITCPVKHLDLGYYDVTLHRAIANIVGFLRPLKLTLNVFCGVPNSGWNLPQAEPSITLHNPSTTWVKHLYIQSGYETMTVPSTANFLSTLRPLVSSSRVELLHIAIGPFFVSNNPEEVVYPPIPMQDDVPEKVKHVDVEEIARGLVQACPFIRTVAISVVMTGHFVWRVERMNGSMEIMRLPSYEGRVRLESEADRLWQTTTSSGESDSATFRM